MPNVAMQQGGYVHYSFGGTNPSLDYTGSKLQDLTNPGSANTKSSYGELIASTEEDANGLLVVIANDASDGHVVDIAIGAASSEVNIAENLPALEQTRHRLHYYYLPIGIPAGTRISERNQGSAVGVGGDEIGVYPVTNGPIDFTRGSKVVSYNIDLTGTDVDLNVDPGASANTKGSWVEFAASTEEDIVGLMWHTSPKTDGSVNTAKEYLVDIGVGAAASEDVVMENIFLYADPTTDSWNPMEPQQFIPCSIPAGSRIAVRCQSSDTTTGERLLHMVLLALYK